MVLSFLFFSFLGNFMISIFHFYSYIKLFFLFSFLWVCYWHPWFFSFQFCDINQLFDDVFPKTLAKLVEFFFCSNLFPQNYPNSLVKLFLYKNITPKKEFFLKNSTLCQLIFFSLLWYPKISKFLGQIYNKKTQFYPQNFPKCFWSKRMIEFVPKKTLLSFGGFYHFLN